MMIWNQILLRSSSSLIIFSLFVTSYLMLIPICAYAFPCLIFDWNWEHDGRERVMGLKTRSSLAIWSDMLGIGSILYYFCGYFCLRNGCFHSSICSFNGTCHIIFQVSDFFFILEFLLCCSSINVQRLVVCKYVTIYINVRL